MEMNTLKGAVNTAPINHQNSPKAFNRYFLSIPKNIIDGIRSKTNQNSNITKNPDYYLLNLFHRRFPSIEFQNTSTREIEKNITSLKMKNSSGYDETSTKVLKISAPFISPPLSYICSKSMLTGIFPARLKYATVKSLLKKGNKENVAI